MNPPLRERIPCRFTPAHNPFRSACVDALDFLPQGTDWTTLTQRLRGANFRGAIVGPHGHGKTTLLLRLTDHVPLRDFLPVSQDSVATRWFQVRPDRAEWRRQRGELLALLASYDGLLMVDGYDLLPWADRARVWRRPRNVLVTSHRVTRLPTITRCVTSPALLRVLIGTLSAEVGAALTDRDVRQLHDARRGNVREALRGLYDVVAA